MALLNYHHLRHFREVAKEGNLTRAAVRLNVSQSTLSIQIKELEARLGHALFERRGRALHLTEVGRIAFDHADTIFSLGEELTATLARTSQAIKPLRVGAMSTLSRNLQLAFLEPLLKEQSTPLTLRSGNMDDLLAQLKAQKLDVVLTTQSPQLAEVEQLGAVAIARQPVALHGRPEKMAYDDIKTLLAQEHVIIANDPTIRSGFESLTARLGIQPKIIADVDDMAMVRLLARSGVGIAIVPSIVLRDELETGQLVTASFDLGIEETFYAITKRRKYPHPALSSLLEVRG